MQVDETAVTFSNRVTQYFDVSIDLGSCIIDHDFEVSHVVTLTFDLV
jgi:hypothetical protein